MTYALWVVQGLLALLFLFAGGMKLVLPLEALQDPVALPGLFLRCIGVDEAIEWLKRAPFDGGTEVEIRPVFEAEDFGAEFTRELREQEERLRAQAAENAKRES